MISVIVFAPLIAAIIAGLGNRAIGNVPAKVVTTGALFLSCALSWPIFISYLAGHAEPQVVPVLHWITSGTLSIDWALRVDALTATMLVVITSVSALVHLYSWGYMDEDPDQPRFFAYLSLFTFAMLMLVTAPFVSIRWMSPRVLMPTDSPRAHCLGKSENAPCGYALGIHSLRMREWSLCPQESASKWRRLGLISRGAGHPGHKRWRGGR